MMRRIYGLVMVSMVAISMACLSGCAAKGDNPFAAYKHKTSSDIFQEAQKHMAKGDYDKASKDLAALDGLYPFGAYTQQGQLDSIYAYYMNNNQAFALAMAQRYIRLYPRSRQVAYAYYMEGVINFDMGGGWLQNKLGLDRSERDITNYETAYGSFATVVSRYASSPYTQDSILRIRFVRNLLAKHELNVARFYEKREAYVAASNRASYIVRHYQYSVSVVPALGVLVRCNRRLNLPKQAEQALALLAYNYPESKTYRSLRSKS